MGLIVKIAATVALSASIEHPDVLTTASIQNSTRAAGRVAFWWHAADLHGQADLVDDGFVASADDATVVARLFGHLGDAERQELLWAAGQVDDVTDAAAA